MSQVLTAKGVLSLSRTAAIARDVGFTPSALVLWCSCQENDGAAPGNRGGLGFVAAGSGSGNIAWASETGVSQSRSASWTGTAAIAGLAEARARAPALLAEVELIEAGFVLHVVRAEPAWRVHFLALGGGHVRAQVGWCSAPSKTGADQVRCGLRPDLVLFASAAGQDSEQPERGLSIAIGAAAGPKAQASTAFVSPDGMPPGSAAGAQRADAAVLAVGDQKRIDAIARVSSFDVDGFTLGWKVAARSTRQVLYLAVAGARCQVGAENSPRAPRRRRVRSTGLDPRGILCFTWGLDRSPAVRQIGRLSLGGASSPTAVGALSWDDRNTPGSSTATHVHSSAEELILVSNTRADGLHAAAALDSFDRGGFTLDWSRSDGIGREFVYVAIGSRRRTRLPALIRQLLTRIVR